VSRVVLHWRTGAETGTLFAMTASTVSVSVEGDDQPFCFDKTQAGWLEHEWGGHAPIRITDAETGQPVEGAC
jgi:hypothetical protein